MTYTYNPPDPSRFLQMLVAYLETQKHNDVATLLASARLEFVTAGVFSRVRWDGFWTSVRLTVPLGRLAGFTEPARQILLKSCDTLMPPEVGYDLMELEVVPAFDDAALDTPVETRAPTAHVPWESLRSDQFERLIFNVVNTTRGYRNAQWLTHTNAPDDGRDLSVYRVHEDALAGTLISRVIVACRHWRARSTGPSEIAELREQMKLWTPPRVDVLVIATSGHFTNTAVRLIEQQNTSDSALKIEPWAGSHLEAMLARRLDVLGTIDTCEDRDIPF